MKYKIHEIKGYIQTIYLVEYLEGLLLLDGCCRCDIPVVESFIANELKLVVSTHAHPDHAGGLFYFKQKGISIAGPKNLMSWYSGVSGFFTYWIDILLTYLVAINKKSGFKNILFPRKISLDFKLNDLDRVPGFEEWQVLSCAGHTGIDLSIWHSKDKIAHVADNFVGNQKNVFRPYPIVYPEKYIDLNIETFLIAHYGKVIVSKEKIEKLIETTPIKARKHTNTLPAIFLKLVKALIRKI